MVADPSYSESMLGIVWIAFLFLTLFLLGCAVGSFLNVCIARLPLKQSLIHPPSRCAHCHKPIRARDNLPLLSYWLLRGRCRACGAPFSMRYFWIELLTGVFFVLILYLEIGCNVHEFAVWDENRFLAWGHWPEHSWTLLAIHAVMGCFLLVAAVCAWERASVPRSVMLAGILTGLLVAMLYPWPWPDEVEKAVAPPLGHFSDSWQKSKLRPPWWQGEVTPRAGLYPWPVWSPLPSWLPAGDWRLGVATALVGVVVGAVFAGVMRWTFNTAIGRDALGTGERDLLMIAGAFLGWQPLVLATPLALLPATIGLIVSGAAEKQRRVSYSLWLLVVLMAVWLGWNWIGPLVQPALLNERRLLLFALGCVAWSIALAASIRAATVRERLQSPLANARDSADSQPDEYEEPT